MFFQYRYIELKQLTHSTKLLKSYYINLFENKENSLTNIYCQLVNLHFDKVFKDLNLLNLHNQLQELLEDFSFLQYLNCNCTRLRCLTINMHFFLTEYLCSMGLSNIKNHHPRSNYTSIDSTKITAKQQTISASYYFSIL